MLYLVVKFVVDLERLARVGEVPCLGLSQVRSKKSRLFWCGFYLDEKDSSYISVIPILFLSSLRFYYAC